MLPAYAFQGFRVPDRRWVDLIEEIHGHAHAVARGQGARAGGALCKEGDARAFSDTRDTLRRRASRLEEPDARADCLPDPTRTSWRPSADVWYRRSGSILVVRYGSYAWRRRASPQGRNGDIQNASFRRTPLPTLWAELSRCSSARVDPRRQARAAGFVVQECFLSVVDGLRPQGDLSRRLARRRAPMRRLLMSVILAGVVVVLASCGGMRRTPPARSPIVVIVGGTAIAKSDVQHWMTALSLTGARERSLRRDESPLSAGGQLPDYLALDDR